VSLGYVRAMRAQRGGVPRGMETFLPDLLALFSSGDGPPPR
jgi:hypothetical protein